MAAMKIATFAVLVVAAALCAQPALAQGTHAHVEDLSAACTTRLNALYDLYTNQEGGNAENPCINTLQRALVGRADGGCPESADIQACFAEHAEEWTAFEADCELLHYHSEEDHDHEGDATEEHAHAPGEEHDHGDDHEVEDGCLPSFETRANFVEYATEAAPADQSALRKQGSRIAVIGFAALAAAAAAANM